MKEKNAKKKTYDEELLWAIIIILMMFITTLDVIWFGRKQQVAETTELDASTTLQTITLGFYGTSTKIYVKGDGKVYSDTSCANSITKISISTKDIIEKYTYPSSGTVFNGLYYGNTCIVKANGTINTAVINGMYSAGKKDNYSASAKYISAQKITLNKNGGTGGADYLFYDYKNGKIYSSDDLCEDLVSGNGTITLPHKKGYTFRWYREQFSSGTVIVYDDGTVSTNSIIDLYNPYTNDYTINAIWGANQYTVTIDYNGATGGNTVTSKTVTYGEKYGLSPTRTGYTLTGWAVYVNGGYATTIGKDDTVSINTNHKIVAQWEKNIYTVTLDKNGGTGGDDKIYYIPHDAFYKDENCTDKITDSNPITIPSKYGYNFVVYIMESNAVVCYSDGKLTSLISSAAFSNPGDFTIHAIYNAWTHTVAFDANGGSGAPSSQTKTYGSVLTLSSTIPTRTGYTFAGWNTASNGTGTNYTAGGEYTADQNGGTVTLYAKWTPNTYTYTLDKQGGSGGADVIYDYYEQGYTKDSAHTSYIGQSSNGISVPTKSGYTFGGYYTETNGGGSQLINSSGYLGSGAMHWAQNMTIYAKWTQKNIKSVTLELNGGTGKPNTIYFYNNGDGGKLYSDANAENVLESIKVPEKSGYKFKGYYVSYANNDIEIIDEKGNVVTPGIFNMPTVSSATAKWEKTGIYKRTLDKNGGTGGTSEFYYWNGGIYSDSSATQEITNITIPSKTGYTFVGYQTRVSSDSYVLVINNDGTKTSNIGAVMMSSSATAIWTANTYTISYNGNGATGGSTANSSHTYDSAKNLTANGYERKYTVTYNHNYTGSTNTSRTATYTFNGWATSASGAKVYGNSQNVKNLSSTNGATVTLYANWSSASVNYTPSRTGYTFGGWYKEAACTNKVSDATYTPTSDITVYAKWIANTYTVTYNYNNATGGKGDNSKSVTYNSKYGTLPSPTRSYLISFNSKGGSNCNAQTATWNFGGWYNGNTNITADTTVTTASNHTLNASWSGGKISLPEPTRTGYTFAGWYSDEQYKNKVDNNTAYTATTTLYAKWTANTYTITYNKNKPKTASESVTGSTNDSTHTYDTSKVLTSNGYALKGWTFTGWNTAANGSGNSYGDGASVSNLSTKNGDTVTLYAQWKANTYTIKYNSNKPSGALTNVTGETKSSSHTYDVSKTLTSNGYALTGWTFKGWNTNDSGTGTSYENGASVSNLSNINGATVNLYAKWEANKYTVTYNYNNATGGNSIANKIVTYNSAYKELPTPTRSYTISFNSNQGTACTNQTATWNFENWFKESNFTTPVTADTIVSTAGNHTIYAKWSNGKITLPTPTRTGYIFRGWYSDSEFKNQVSNTTQYNSNTTLYAKWEAIKYTVTYNSNKPEIASSSVTGSTADSTHTYDVERSLTKNGYALTGWTFTGWNTSANGNGTSYADEAKVVNQTATNGGRITLYAQWRANTYTVTYNKNNATEFDGETSKVVTYDTQYGSLPSVKRIYSVVFATNGGTPCVDKTSRYNFEGWYLGSNKIISSTYVHTPSDHQLTAKWSGGEIELPATIKEGYNFEGWYNEAGEKVGNAGEKYAPTSDETLFAHYIGKEYTLTVNPNGGQWKDSTSKQNVVGRMGSSIILDVPTAPNGYKVVFSKNNGKEDETITQTRTFLGWETTGVGSINGNQYTYGAGNSEIVAKYSTNDAITLPTAEKQGYTFAGWYSDSALNTKVGNAGDNYIPKANTILYAKWNSNTNTEYKVEYYTEKLDGSYELNNTATFTGTTDSVVTAEQKIIEGFEFNENNSSNVKQGTVKPDGNLILKLYYARKLYTVTLDVNEGNSLETKSKQVKYGDKYGDLPEPTKEGYTFAGWYNSKVDGDRVTTTTNVEKSENHTIYAHWKINSYTLTINPNGGEYNGYDQSSTYTQEYNSTKEIENPSKTKAGYKISFINLGGETVEPITQTTKFDSWEINGAGKIETVNSKNIYTFGSKDTTIKANYVGEDITLPEGIKAGHVFKGWYTSDDIKAGTTGEAYNPSSDITLYAVYDDEYYDLTINPNGGEWKGSKEVQKVAGKYGSSKVIADPKAPKVHTIKLHMNDGTNTVKDLIQTSTFEGWEIDNGNGTLIGKTYKYGAGEDTLTAIYTENDVELPEPTKAGYTFQGWYSDEACTEKFGDAGYTYNPTEDGELYAKWAANTYTITFNVNDGDNLENNTKDVVYAEKYGELPIPTRAGYTFVGWFNSVSKEITADSIVDITENIVLTAKWTESELTITFDVYKGQVEPTSKKVIYKQEYGTLPIPTMEGCEFEGWYDSQEQLANKVIDTSIVRKTEDHTLYAKWKDIQGPKFTYDINNIYTIEVHSEIPVFNVTATDNYDDNVDITVTNNIQKDVVGTYEYIITATDKAGNTTTETKEFKVVDTTAPEISIKDDVNVYEMEVHGEKPTFLATATDNYDEHVDVVVTDNIDIHTVGTYKITFTATDTNGNVQTDTRSFEVKDTTPPVITPSEENVYEMEVHGEKPEFKATATDNYDEHVDVEITDDIDVHKVGTYTITFKAKDTNNNSTTTTRSFKVVDTTPPVITVDDENNKYTMEVHGEKPEFKATAIDNYDGEIGVEITDDINVDVVGTYTVTFKSTDTNNNTSTETREFKVVDTTAPVITVDDENNKYEMRVFEEIPTFTATATDNYDEEVTVKITNTIDRTNVGTYTVTFTATDKAGNEAKVEREFKVLKTKPEYEIPTGIEARYIDTLADVKLPEGFTFEDDLSTSVGPEGENTFKVTFTPKDLHNYEIVTGIEIVIKVNYLNVDTNGDGKADLNVDTDGDGKADLNVDTDRNGKADLNVDTDGDGKADLNVDIDGDGKPDLNIDTDGDGKPDKNLQKDEDKSDDPTNNEDSDIIYSNEDYSGSNTYTKGNLRIYSEKYIFGNKYMEYVKNKTTVKALKSWCTSNGTIEVYDKGGMLKMKDTDYIGTGMILKVTKDEESMSFIIVVQGDTSGDGIVTTADAAQVEFHILNKKVLEGAAFRAADINRNKAVTGEDLATITRSLQYLEAESVNPNYVEEVEETTEEPKDTAETTDEETEDTAKKEENNTNSTINKDTIKENTNTTNNTKKEDTKDNKDKENTNKTDTTKDNKVNETEEKENNTENKTTEKTEDTSSEKVNLPENDTVQYKKQEE